VDADVAGCSGTRQVSEGRLDAGPIRPGDCIEELDRVPPLLTDG
jgi:hypothetical protein